MKYRFFVALCAIFFLAGCAALDTDNTPYEGMQQGDAIPGLALPGMGPHTGYYAGTMTMQSNTCSAVSDEVGQPVAVVLDILHRDNAIEAVFEDGPTVFGDLDGDDVTMVVNAMGIKHIYYLAFGEEELSGEVDVIEPDENGAYGASCATYTIALEKGQKPLLVVE